MSRKLVLVSVFLAVLPVLLVALKARSDDPKKAGGTPAPQKAEDEIFGSPGGGGAAKSDQSNSEKPKVGAAKPDESKPPTKPIADSAKPKPSPAPEIARRRESDP